MKDNVLNNIYASLCACVGGLVNAVDSVDFDLLKAMCYAAVSTLVGLIVKELYNSIKYKIKHRDHDKGK